MDAAAWAALAAASVVVLAWPAGASRLRAVPPDAAQDPAAEDRRQRWIAAVAVGGAAAFLGGSMSVWLAWLGLPVMVGSWFILGRLVSATQRDRQAALAAALPQACDLLVVCLEAGLPVRSAVQTIAEVSSGPLALAMGEAAAKTALGVDERRVWDEFGADPALAKLGRELQRGAASGVSLAARLRAVGVDARTAAAAAAETRAKRVGVRSVLPLMACFLPAFVLLGVVPIIGGMVLRVFG